MLPLAAAAPLLAKAGMFAKGLVGLGAAKAGTSALVTGAMGKGLAARGAIGAATQGARKFAGNALASYMGPGGVTAGNVAANFAPDAVFGVMQGAMTPGDLGDKLIAGGSTAIGGALGGVGAVSALGKFGQQGGGRMLAEFGGGMLGDMVGQSAGDVVLRAKGGGTTPWEKVQQQGDQEYRQQLEREVLAAYGIGGYNQTDLLG
jgi:hypothetical protein